MSAADELRQAAKVLREAAGKATPGPWDVSGWGEVRSATHLVTYGPVSTGLDEEIARGSAAYIALMGPTLGLALAAWLDVEAVAAATANQGLVGIPCSAGCCAGLRAALTIARLINGTKAAR